MFLPMSWTSPLTVAMTMRPLLALPSPFWAMAVLISLKGALGGAGGLQQLGQEEGALFRTLRPRCPAPG